MSEALRTSLAQQLSALDAQPVPAVTPGCPSDAADTAMKLRERDDIERMMDQRRRQRAALVVSLARLEAGTHGHCEACEEPIAPARLQAVPTATMCVSCRGEAEQRGR
jgi:DnaK suppressor protein